MTREERLSIEAECLRLIHLYTNLNDEGRWDDAANLFTQDGVFYRPSTPDSPIIGRAAILAAFKSRPPRTTRHICANAIVSVESETRASAFSLILLYTGKTDAGGQLPVLEPTPLIGGFNDKLVRERDSWRFTERKGSLFFRTQ